MICSTIVTSDSGRNERLARIVRPCSSIASSISSVLGRLALLIVVIGALTDSVQAQWMIRTPRDTVRVYANQKTPVRSLLNQNDKVMVSMTFTRTFGAVKEQNGTGFDARYMYEQFPGWSTPTPLANPPTYGSKNYQIYLAVSVNKGLTFNGLNTIETSYQPNHTYTALYQSSAVPFQFVIMNRLNEKIDGFYYSQGTGYIEVALARFTAGIRVQTPSLAFGSVAIGSSSTILDSIESYGVDPLQVDSAHIEAAPGSPGWTDFSFVSQNGIKYTLPSERTNTYSVKFTPSTRTDSYARLVIYCRNTDGPSRVVVIPLHGVGTAPISVIGPKSIDFGKNRINFLADPHFVNVSNIGNGVLNVLNVKITPDDGTFTASPTTMNVGAGATRQLKVTFKPTAPIKYSAKMTISTDNATEIVDLSGEGGTPKLLLTETFLNFGVVRRNDRNTLKVTLTNTGNWTSSIKCFLAGPGKSNYSFTPDEPTFLLNPGVSREYTITFSPATGPEGTRTAELDFYEDDGSAPQRVMLVGVEAEPKLVLGRQLVDFGKMFVGWPKSDTVSLINTSNASLAFATPVVLPAAAPFSAQHNPLNPNVVEPNVHDSLVITFRPVMRGQFSAKVFTDANGQKDSIDVIGIGALPKAVFTPPIIDFGTVVTGKTGSQYVLLTDTGDYPLHVKSFTISPNNQGFSIPPAMPTPPFTVFENYNGVTLYVEFQTMLRTGNSHYAYLVVHYAEGGSDSVLMIAKEQAEFVHYNESNLDFGKVHVGASLEKLATFSHGSIADLSVGRAWVEQPSPFHSDSSKIVVLSGQTSQTRVLFQPTVKGTFKGFLQDSGLDIKNRDTLFLTGIGAEGVATLSDDTLDFGLVYHRQTSGKSLTLRNDGDWDLGWSWRIDGDPAGEFTFIPSDTSTILGEAKSTDFAVRFTPKRPEYPKHEADLIFTFDNGTLDSVHLIAWDSIPYLALDSEVIDFGKIRVPNPSARTLHLVNTTPLTLTASNVGITPAGAPYTISPAPIGGAITVTGPRVEPLTVTFTPTTMGPFDAELVASGNDMLDSLPDKVILHGIGAMPVPVFSKPIVDFGRLTVGVVGQDNIILTNKGNWDLHITSVTVSGGNQIDYVYSFPQDTVIKEGESTLIPLAFVAKTTIQSTPRSASLDFTIDDGTTFSLPLTELDKAPLETEIGFENRLARPGDEVHVPLQLSTFIPPEFAVRSLSGEVTFDPAVVQLTWHGKGPLIGSDRWKINTVESAGKLAFQITSDTLEEILSDPGVLIRFNFLARPGVPPGAKSELHVNLLAYPDTKEVVGVERMGVIIIDSTCGNTHIMEGAATANMVDQNTPNPFGPGIGAEYSYIPFDVGVDGTLVTIRILDESGKEVLRPVDNLSYVQGRYRVRVHARSLTSGLYFYEFRAGSALPVIKKMVVAD